MIFLLNGAATTQISTLSLHDALPIWPRKVELIRWAVEPSLIGSSEARPKVTVGRHPPTRYHPRIPPTLVIDRKSTRLNSSHPSTSYAVFCLKKKTATGPKLELIRWLS